MSDFEMGMSAIPTQYIMADGRVDWDTLDRELAIIEKEGIQMAGQTTKSIAAMRAFVIKAKNADLTIIQIESNTAAAFDQIFGVIESYKEKAQGIENEKSRSRYLQFYDELQQDAARNHLGVSRIASGRVGQELAKPVVVQKKRGWFS